MPLDIQGRIRRSIDLRRQSGVSHQSLGSAVFIGTTFGRHNRYAQGGVRQDIEFQSWLLRLGVRYLTGGSDVGYILSAGRTDVKQLSELKL